MQTQSAAAECEREAKLTWWQSRGGARTRALEGSACFEKRGDSDLGMIMLPDEAGTASFACRSAVPNFPEFSNFRRQLRQGGQA